MKEKFIYEKYDEKGYINFDSLLMLPANYFMFIGARGTGKTFNSIRWCLEHNKQFIYLRSRQVEIDILKSPEYSPFEPLNIRCGRSLEVKKDNMYISSIYEYNEKRGAMFALSNAAKVRGFNGDAISWVLYDEFIHEANEKPLKREAESFFQLLETIGRNRELEGKEPLKAILMANSNELDNDFFRELRIADKFRALQRKGKDYFYLEDRKLLVMDFSDSPLAEQKKNTALAKLTSGTKYYEMAFGNEFSHNRTDKIKSQDLRNWEIETKINDIYVYHKKGQPNKYYVSLTAFGTPRNEINPFREGHKLLIRNFIRYYNAFVSDRLIFENATAQFLFEAYYKGL